MLCQLIKEIGLFHTLLGTCQMYVPSSEVSKFWLLLRRNRVARYFGPWARSVCVNLNKGFSGFMFCMRLQAMLKQFWFEKHLWFKSVLLDRWSSDLLLGFIKFLLCWIFFDSVRCHFFPKVSRVIGSSGYVSCTLVSFEVFKLVL